MEQARKSLLRLHLSPGIGRTTLFKLYRHFGCFDAAVKASPRSWNEAGINPELHRTVTSPEAPELSVVRKKIDDFGIRLISYWDENYPALLRTIYDPPALLYLRGTLPEGEAFAIVGSRKATPGGIELAGELAGKLAERGICVVSGLARGVDSAAHQGALDVQGTTIAVLGCGVDRVYPAENTRLFMKILDRNAIISEYPPGTGPLAGHFPGRNRIISGLCRGVLIVEAAAGSGSLITADFALEQGRELFATPGAVHHPNSHGPHRLLKEGAQIVTDVDDILQVLWPERLIGGRPEIVERQVDELDSDTRKVYLQLGATPLHHDEIARKCALTPMELSAILLDLELRGGARQLPGGHYVRGSR